ncbi:hypothetical protein JVU11DRAFT_2239 [Chiua virens]|nr:hypothetical protein JVU11DRAFT_2239 [Chiua virens]
MVPRTSSGHKWNWHSRYTPSLLALALVFSLLSSVHATYFVVNQPGSSTQWANGSPFPISWSKGLLDGINTFDVEMTRASEQGLYRIAQDVPTTYNTLNILLQDVPAGDDYFLVCLNSTHGVVYAVSSRFSITNSSGTNPSPDPSAPTATISGTPNPLQTFAATLGAAANGAGSLIFDSSNTRVLGFGGILALGSAFLGGFMTLC